MKIANGKIKLRTADDRDPEELAKKVGDMRDWLNCNVASEAYALFGVEPKFYFDEPVKFEQVSNK
jgi:hypothetical protein